MKLSNVLLVVGGLGITGVFLWYMYMQSTPNYQRATQRGLPGDVAAPTSPAAATKTEPAAKPTPAPKPTPAAPSIPAEQAKAEDKAAPAAAPSGDAQPATPPANTAN
ncbi:MAG: hypothetical protein VX589_01890 [Myxococcota bacterium]|nr:hypothetical protein [Myxococcota bacterium]